MAASKPQLPAIPRYDPNQRFMAIPPEWWQTVSQRLQMQNIKAGAGLRVKRASGRVLLMRR